MSKSTNVTAFRSAPKCSKHLSFYDEATMSFDSEDNDLIVLLDTKLDNEELVVEATEVDNYKHGSLCL